MSGRVVRPGAWIALLVLPLLAACEDKKSTPTAKAPVASDLRVRLDAGGVAGQPTQFSLTIAFADADADVATLEVKRLDTGEVTAAELPEATGKAVGLAEGTFTLTATVPGDIPMTATVLDAKDHRSADLGFVIGIQAPPPPEEGSAEEALHPRPAGRSLATRGARVLRGR